MEQYKIGIIGATGMVGQRFALLTANHPWFQPVVRSSVISRDALRSASGVCAISFSGSA